MDDTKRRQALVAAHFQREFDDAHRMDGAARNFEVDAARRWLCEKRRKWPWSGLMFDESCMFLGLDPDVLRSQMLRRQAAGWPMAAKKQGCESRYFLADDIRARGKACELGWKAATLSWPEFVEWERENA